MWPKTEEEEKYNETPPDSEDSGETGPAPRRAVELIAVANVPNDNKDGNNLFSQC
jgi:hypothetical protein